MSSTRRRQKQPAPPSLWKGSTGPYGSPPAEISRKLIAAGYEVISTDLVDYGYGEPGRDFLAERKPRARHIVTNPPYGRGLADAFVKHALQITTETDGTVAMLLNLLSLCHPLRHDFYVAHPPAVIYALDECICWPYGDPSQVTTSIAKQRYCWLVRKRGAQGPTQFRWLTTRAAASRVT